MPNDAVSVYVDATPYRNAGFVTVSAAAAERPPEGRLTRPVVLRVVNEPAAGAVPPIAGGLAR